MKSPELGYYGFMVCMLLKGDGWGMRGSLISKIKTREEWGKDMV